MSIIFAISYDHQSVGKRIKSSKKRHIWKVSINGTVHQIDLFLSKFSGKKTLKIDDYIKFAGKKLVQETFPISESDTILLKQAGKRYDLFINNAPFQKFFDSKVLFKHPEIVINHIGNWEDKAKPYKKNFRINNSTREKVPIKSFSNTKSQQKLDHLNFLAVSFTKPRSSSMKSSPENIEFTDLLS